MKAVPWGLKVYGLENCSGTLLVEEVSISSANIYPVCCYFRPSEWMVTEIAAQEPKVPVLTCHPARWQLSWQKPCFICITR